MLEIKPKKSKMLLWCLHINEKTKVKILAMHSIKKPFKSF